MRIIPPAQIKLDALVPLGPTFLLRVKHCRRDFYHRIIVELWLYPDGSRVFGISTKCTPDQAFQAGVEFRAFMAKSGIPLKEAQETKTNGALEFFRKDITAPRHADRQPLTINSVRAAGCPSSTPLLASASCTGASAVQ